MSVYSRHFKVTEGPIIEEMKRIRLVIKAAQDEYSDIVKDMGADPGYYQRDNELTGVLFTDNKVDRALFKPVGRNGKYGWYPKKTHREGRLWAGRLAAVETAKDEDVLSLAGIPDQDRFFWLCKGGKVYFPTVIHIPKPLTAVIRVPWYDEDPEKIERYRRDPEGVECDSIFLWEPKPEMVEIKEWEFLKLVEEYNTSIASPSQGGDK